MAGMTFPWTAIVKAAGAQRRLAAALANMPHGLCMFDAEKRLVLCNARYAEMYRLPPDLVRPGTPLAAIVAHRQQAGNAPMEFPNYVTHDGVAFARGANSTFEFKLQDGRTIRLNHLALEGGGYVATHEDVSEISEGRAARELADVRAAMVADLERRNDELEAFAYTVSHDLRSPLRAIDGFSSLLLDDCGDGLDGVGREYIGRIRQAANRMRELIDDVLELSRVTKAEMKIERVDLSDVAREVADGLQAQDASHPVDVTIGDNLVADADRRMIRIVLENLLGNAWKFSHGAEQPRIEFNAAQGGHPTYVVRDNGAGFDMEHASKLFQPFQRLHSDAEFPGIGIGLATIHRVIDRHGGRVWAEGAVGRGASFFFALPEHAVPRH